MSLRWSDLPWSAKLTLLLGFLAIAPLTAVTLLHGIVAREELLEATRAQRLQKARATAQIIDRYLERVLSDVRILALLPWTSQFLEQPDGPGLRPDVESALRSMRETHGFDVVLLTDNSGTVLLASDPGFTGRSYVAFRSFLQAATGVSGVTMPRWDPEDGEVFLYTSAPVRGRDGRVQGAVLGRLNLKRIDEIIAADTGFGGNEEAGVLWDTDGIRLSAPAQPELLFRPLEPLPADTADRLAAEQRFGPQTRSLLAAPSWTAPGIVERSRWLLYDGASDPHLRFAAGGQPPVHATLVPLASTRWVYGILSPESAILDTLEAQSRRNLAVVGLTALLAITLGLLAARWATRPLRLVGQTANAIAAGDMSRRVGLRQHDEVGHLAAAFDVMADALAEKDAELRRHAGRLERQVEEQTAELRSSVLREQEARHRAEEANRIKDEFLSTLSHELRTPLNSILGWTWLLRSGSLDPEAAQRAVATIERNARSQSQIVDDLLDVSRIITGKLRLKIRRVDLPEVIEAAVDALRPAAGAREIRIATTFDPEAPAVSGDPNRLQQVVWNLLGNAVKFTPEGGRIDIRLERADGQVRIRVSDTGIGISPDFLPYVFDRFRQADSSTTRLHGGLGLGLSIVRHLVELHGGTVQAESGGDGKGATFTVLLPSA